MPTLTSPSIIPVLVGIPDDAQVKVDAAGSARTPRLVIPGTAVFLNYLPTRLQQKLPLVHCTSNGGLSANAPSLGGAVINLSADPDVARRALHVMADAITGQGGVCFNHPAPVLLTGRHEVATRLGGIPGLVVPPTVRVRLAEPDDLRDVVEAAGMQWPVILRVAGVQSGGTTVRIDSPRQAAEALATILWGGRPVYVTQYVPYADADGMHRKLRIVVVGEEAFLRHEVTGANWQMHAGDHDPRFNAAEFKRVERFATDLLPALRDRLRAISEVMALDFFGLDCSLRPDGSLLVFECNAAMNVMREKRMMPGYAGAADNSPDHVRGWQASARRIHEALVRLIFEPARWRHAAAVAGT